MGKTSLKTFVCSFVLSLFTILTVSKEFFVVSKPSDNEIKIPNKNISLFFKDMPSHTLANKTIPIKKIALTVPLPQAEEPPAALPQSDIIPLTFAENDIAFAENDIELDIPPLPEAEVLPPPPVPDTADAETNVTDETPQQEQQADVIDDKELLEPFSSKIVQAKVQIIRPNEKKIAQRLQKTAPAETETVSAHEDIPLEKAEENPKIIVEEAPSPNEPPEEKNLLLAAVPDEDISQDDTLQADDDVQLPPTFAIAKAAVNPDAVLKDANQNNTAEPENLLIPLQKDSNIPLRTAEAKVVDAPDTDKMAMLTGKATIQSMEESVTPQTSKEETPSGWQTMAQKNNEDSTWVAAKGAGHARNKQTTKEKYYQNADNQEIKKILRTEKQTPNGQDTKLASQVVKNLLIPIPEDILNDPDLTPQLVASEQDKEIEQQLIKQENQLSGQQTTTPRPQAQASSSEDKSLLKSLTSIFGKDDGKPTAESTNKGKTSFIDRLTGKRRKNTPQEKILPTEIRLAFQPNRAEISGITLKWIQAFAYKTIEDDSAGLEIRIDGASSYQLQQKRLNLLHNILTNNGVDYRKIKTVFTTREPNSFIIRTVRLNNDSNGGIKEDNEWQDYYKAW